MKRVIVVTAALLASALSAHAGSVNKRQRVVNGRACHRIVITEESDAIGYAFGQIQLPSWDEIRRCYPRGRDNGGSDHLNRMLYQGIY